MKKPARRYVLGPFTDKELKVIELRTNGVKTPEIARRMGVPRATAYTWLWSIYRKAGVNDVALLTRWAIENAMDVTLGPERPEERPVPGMPKKRGKQRIRMGRVRQGAPH
jgi:DNA-binding CsgD family transcriptional regulator